MVQRETTFQILYVSQMAHGADFGIVREVVTAARHRNPARGITGALLFDGERFCQLLEGPEPVVKALMKSIARDPRHTQINALFTGPCLGERAMQRWASGYCDACLLEAFDGDTGLRDRPALDAFISVLKGADLV